MFDSFSNVDYRQLLPGGSGDSRDPGDGELGIYADSESRAQAAAAERGWLGNQLHRVSEMLPEMTWRERLLGCGTCMLCGYLLGFGSFLRMKDLVTGNPIPLVVNVTAGNLIALMGTCFLSGPSQQARRMWHETRRFATVLYLGSLVITVILLTAPRHRGKGFILFLLMIGQYVAITWYCLTYIPFARDLVKRGCRRLVSAVDEEG